ncbi:hypothetical protein FQZ97_710650 [compost metagenome]
MRLAGHGGQLARHFHVGRVLRKADRDIVRAQGHGGLDVVHVLGRQRRRRQAAALAVDALVVGQVAANAHGGEDLGAQHAVHHQHDQAVVEQQQVAGADVARQVLVVQADAFLIAELAGGIEDKGVARLERDLAVLELADTDLGALQVGHDGDLAPARLGGLAHQAGAVDMVLRGAVREIQPHHVDACGNHARQDLQRAGGGADGGNDLGGTGHARVSLVQDGGPARRQARRMLQPAARCSSTSKAGSFLPSRNSRNAPPPVEM